MRRMIRFELKKILLRPVSVLAFVLLIVINCLSVFTDGAGAFISHDDITAQKAEQAAYAGRIDQSWANAVREKLNIVTREQDNLMPDNEREQVRKEYLGRGYTQQSVNNLPNSVFLKPEIEDSLPYRILKDAEYSARFYTNAEKLSAALGKQYRAEYPGEKGRVLSQKAKDMYGYLANQYTAVYGYNSGWNKLISMQRLLPFTLGVFLLIALSSIFSGEYNRKTDSLLLSSKYGKSKLIYAKITAAFLAASGIWLLLQLLNMILAYGFFGLDGAQTFVQDWQLNACPFAFTQGTNYFAVCGMSFTGVLFFTAVILLISAGTKSPFFTFLISGTVLMMPTIANLLQMSGFITQILIFFPTNILIAADHFTFFKAYYFLGRAWIMQIAVPVSAVAASGLLTPFAYRVFQKHQTEN